MVPPLPLPSILRFPSSIRDRGLTHYSISGEAAESVPRAHHETDKEVDVLERTGVSHCTGVLSRAVHPCIGLGVTSRFCNSKISMHPANEADLWVWGGDTILLPGHPPRLREHPGVTNEYISLLWVYNCPDDAP
jgi:hypothetical protein